MCQVKDSMSHIIHKFFNTIKRAHNFHVKLLLKSEEKEELLEPKLTHYIAKSIWSPASTRR